jgi:hypothetical protein
MNKKRILLIVVSLALGLSGLPGAMPAAASPNSTSQAAKYMLGEPTATPLGTYAGIDYIQYDGIFEGYTSTGNYRVPYRITAPADPRRGNQSVIVEPSHYAIGLGALELNLGRDFLFSRGFSYAGIGWSTTSGGDGFNMRILDPTVPGVFINGGVPDENGRTDDEIITDFARALAVDPEARQMLGLVKRRYATGFSDSSDPLLRLITSGRAAGVFDFALVFTAEAYDPQAALAAKLYRGKLIILNSEYEGISASFVDHGATPDLYRFYAVAGTPHVPDYLEVPFFTSKSTPASYQPELRAHFLQGHAWVLRGTQPPPSNHLKTSDGVTLDRDVNGNTISVNASGQFVPRLPFVELGEAHFICCNRGIDIVGDYEHVKTIGKLGFKSHNAYLQAFDKKLADYVKAGYMLQEDANAMLRRATLCPKLTFTETYRDHYDTFTAVLPCNGGKQ